LVTFFAQAKKVTRSPAGRVEALHFKRRRKSKELDSGLTSSAVESRRNDEQKLRTEGGFRRKPKPQAQAPNVTSGPFTSAN
jgi:hypothetical protein